MSNYLQRPSFVIKIVKCLKTVSNRYLPYFSFLRCICSKFVTQQNVPRTSNPVPDLLVRTPREPQENLKRTPREHQENPKRKRFLNRILTWEPRPRKYLYHENPTRTPNWTPREPQENPKRTARVVPSSNFKEELKKNKTKAQVTGVLFGCLKLWYS